MYCSVEEEAAEMIQYISLTMPLSTPYLFVSSSIYRFKACAKRSRIELLGKKINRYGKLYHESLSLYPESSLKEFALV